MDREELLDFVVGKCTPTDLETALLSIKEIKEAYWQENVYSRLFWLMSGYKPVYFLLK